MFDRIRLTHFGMVKLFITIDSTSFQKTMMLDFVVANEDSSYQINLGRPFFKISKVMVSNHYLALKYRVNNVVGVVKRDQIIAQGCYATTAKETMQITSLGTRGDAKKERYKTVEEIETVSIKQEKQGKIAKIGSKIEEGLKENLVNYLQLYAYMFA